MPTIKDLERECLNYNLTDYLKKCSSEELEYFMRLILCDDITGIRIKIYDSLLTELEYRKLSSSLNPDFNENKIYMMLNYYKYDLEDIDYNDIKKTIKFYNDNKINYNDVINWFPAGISLEMCYVVYKFMLGNGISKEQIKKLLIGNLKQVKQLAKKLMLHLDKNTVSTTYENDKDFINFMIETINLTEKSKSKTESFDKVYNKLYSENSNIIKRLK